MDEPPNNLLGCELGIETVQGPRARNEDFAAALRADDTLICAIADGMGGHSGGREAAEICVRSVIDALIAQPATIGPRRACMVAIDPINSWIHAIGRRDPLLAHMGCTLTLAILRGRRIHVAHVGDTRLYRLRDGNLDCLTQDHTPGTPGTKNQLTRAIGLSDTARVDYDSHEIAVHDRYLLCSDGVHGGLDDRRLASLLGRRAAPARTAADIVESSMASGSGDNATALVLDVLSLPPFDALGASQTLAALPVIAPPRAGAVIDGYQLAQMLADGRYSRVFRAQDLRMGRKVIVKFPQPSVGADAALRQAFLREAMVANAVQSPFVGEILAPQPDRQSALYLVMPYYQGETLERRLLRGGPVPRAEGLDIATKLSKAVIALHRRGIIHRDIKPENVILEPGGGVSLIDLRVASLPRTEESSLVLNPGTPSYMAPELFKGAISSEQTDLYALGVTVYRLFAGGYPYGEVEPFSHPRFGRPVPLLTRRPDLPAWLDRVVMRAIMAEPGARSGDVLEYLFELEHGELRGAPGPATKRSLYERNPLRFWQVTAALFALLAIILLVER